MATLLERITTDRDVMVGKPCVQGTRVPVELVLKHLADTGDIADVLAAFPRLTLDDVRACVAYANERMRNSGPIPAGS